VPNFYRSALQNAGWVRNSRKMSQFSGISKQATIIPTDG